MLGFAERNPGITRVLLGDAIVGERERLHERVERFFDRLTTQLRQVLREAELRRDATLRVKPQVAAAVLTAYVEGRMHQFMRTRFREPVLSGWDDEWRILQNGVFEADKERDEASS